MQIMIIIKRINYQSHIFQIKMIYRLTKEATIMKIKTITSLMMILLRNLKQKKFYADKPLDDDDGIVKNRRRINGDELLYDLVNQITTTNDGEL